MIWYLQDPNRYAAELAALRAAEAEGQWLSVDGVRVDAEMRICVDLAITAAATERVAVLRYPQTFAFTPPTVSPRDPERWSGHQYGRAELCLEWGPDNWRPELTGADMVQSALRLLTTETSDGVNESTSAPSRHKTTQGQDLRSKWARLLITEALSEKLRTAPRGEVVKVHMVDLDRAETSVVAPSKITGSDGATWENPDVPPMAKVARSDEAPGYGLPAGVALPTMTTYSGLRLFLAQHGFDLPADADAPAYELAFVWGDDGPALFWIRRQEDKVYGFTPLIAAGGQRLDPEHAVLTGKTVGLVGCGALGSKWATSLARSGVRKLVLLDDDVLLPENLVRHDLDWTSMGEHKATALARRLALAAPGTVATVKTQRLGAQEASGGIDWTLSRLQECDLIVDATANPAVFNLLSSIAGAARKPLVWAEIFGGGFGGLIARSRPGLDPPPQEARARIESWCAAQGVETPRPGADYDLEAEQGPMIADDADVAVIAAWAARYTIDLLLETAPSQFPNSAYLIGLREEWLFTQPFHTIPLDLGQPLPATAAAPASAEALKAIIQLFNLGSDAPAPAA